MLLATGVLATLLAACGTTENTEAADGRMPIDDTPPVVDVSPPEVDNSPVTIVAGESFSPEFVAFVDLAKVDDLAALAASLNGKVIDYSGLGLSAAGAGAPAIGFIAFEQLPLSSLSADIDGLVIEENQDRFFTSATLESTGVSRVWAEGTSRVWAEGVSRVWAEGVSRVWAEGESRVWAEGNAGVWRGKEFAWMPENTTNWNRINLREGHSEAKRLGRGITVAVIDTGFDLEHPALAGSFAEGGRDFVDNDWDPTEEGSDADGSYGHGTVVAGIVRQIAPRASILPIRALEADGSGDVLNVVQAVYYAIDEQVDIINLSLGGPVESPALSAAIRQADAEGIFVTISAGNDNKDTLNYPAQIAKDGLNMVISVTNVDVHGNKSYTSNYGTAAEIAAPGEMIFGPYPNLGSAAWTGTSMAAPVVAGAIALALGEPDLEVRRNRIAREMFSEASNIYRGGRNAEYNPGNSRLLGAGLLDIEDFLDEVVD